MKKIWTFLEHLKTKLSEFFNSIKSWINHGIVIFFIFTLVILMLNLYKNIFLGDWINLIFLIFGLITIFALTITHFKSSIEHLLEKNINNYAAMAILLILIIFFVGIFMLNNFFPSYLPLPLKSNRNNFDITCSHYKDYSDFIINRTVLCSIKLPKNFDIVNKEKLSYLFLINGVESSIKVVDWTGENNFNVFVGKFSTEEDIIFIDLISHGVNHSYIVDSFHINPSSVYTINDYQTRETKKITYFVALLSLSIFSVLSGVNNIKQIMEDRIDRSKEGKKKKK